MSVRSLHLGSLGFTHTGHDLVIYFFLILFIFFDTPLVCYPLSGCPSWVCPKMVIPPKNTYFYRGHVGYGIGVIWGHMGFLWISQLHGFIIQHRRSWWSSSASCVASSPKSVGRCRASVPRSPWRRCWKRSNALRRWSTRSCHGTSTVVEMEMLGGFGTSKLNLNVGKSVGKINKYLYIYIYMKL